MNRLGETGVKSWNDFSYMKKPKTSCKSLVDDVIIFSTQKEKKKKNNNNKTYRVGRWNQKEHKAFINGIFKIGKNNWKKLEEEIPSRNSTQIRSHAQKFLSKLLKKHDILSNILIKYVLLFVYI